MTLDQIGVKYGTDKSSLSSHNYLTYYETLFAPVKNHPITLVEIGVQFGNSINTWLEYFPEAMIHGIDITNDFKSENSKNPHFRFWLGSQSDDAFMRKFASQIPHPFIVIDDGSHRVSEQQAAFLALWPVLEPGGYYIVEDVETWWDRHFDSALPANEWFWQLIGALNWNGHDYHGKPSPTLPVTDYQKSFASITLRKGLVVIQKA